MKELKKEMSSDKQNYKNHVEKICKECRALMTPWGDGEWVCDCCGAGK